MLQPSCFKRILAATQLESPYSVLQTLNAATHKFRTAGEQLACHNLTRLLLQGVPANLLYSSLGQPAKNLPAPRLVTIRHRLAKALFRLATRPHLLPTKRLLAMYAHGSAAHLSECPAIVPRIALLHVLDMMMTLVSLVLDQLSPRRFLRVQSRLGGPAHQHRTSEHQHHDFRIQGYIYICVCACVYIEIVMGIRTHHNTHTHTYIQTNTYYGCMYI